MQAINVNTLMDDPLAGSVVAEMADGPYNTFLGAVQTRLRLLTSTQFTNEITDTIFEEFRPIRKIHRDYFVNELLYEFRLAKGNQDPAFENAVMKNWVAKIISKKGQDAGLDFLNLLKHNREKRIR